MTLKENSKAYEFLLVSMLLSGGYSLVMTIWAIINNMGLPHTTGVNVITTINAISGRLPIIILCILYITAGRKIENCVKALSIYYVLNIVSTLLVATVNYIFRNSVGNVVTVLISIFLSALAFVGLWDIKNGGNTGVFKGVIATMTAYELYINGSMIIGTAKTLAGFPNYFTIQITSILTLVFYVVFNTAQYIFAKDITKIND